MDKVIGIKDSPYLAAFQRKLHDTQLMAVIVLKSRERAPSHDECKEAVKACGSLLDFMLPLRELNELSTALCIALNT